MSGALNPLFTPSDPQRGKPYALLVLLQLHWFVRLRWVFAAFALGILAIERFVLPESHRPWQLLVVVLGVPATNVVWFVTSRLLRRQLEEPGANQPVLIRNGQIFASAQISTDLFLLTWILSLTGGVENPMTLFYLFHIAITGLLLRTWQAFLQSCWAVALFTAMCIAQLNGWIPFYPFLPHLGAFGFYNQPHYVGIVIGVVALAVFGTLYFTDRIGHILEQREDMLIRTNAALEQSRQAIQDLQQRRSRFMQVAAHQLKSPLAMVQTLANLIRDGIVTDAAGIQATCDKIVRRSRDGMAQVSELLALARVQEADPRRHRDASANLGQIVADLCTRHAAIAAEKQQQFTWQVPADCEIVAHVDPTDLRDCVGNLIENAIKYTPDRGRVDVLVTCGRQPPAAQELPAPPPRLATAHGIADFVFVIVKDTGIGLGKSEQIQPDGTPAAGSLFDAFRRGEAAIAAGIPGSGLGLSIVREVIEQAGGYIHVVSKPGQGSTFTVAFPARCEERDQVRDTRSAQVVVERPNGPAGSAVG